MYNQIRAEFYKLFHTKALYLTFALILAVFGIFSIGGQQQFVVSSSSVDETWKIGETVGFLARAYSDQVHPMIEEIIRTATSYTVFFWLIVLIFSVVFFSREYTDSTIKIAIASGQSRLKFFIAKYIVITVTSIILYFSFIMVAFIIECTKYNVPIQLLPMLKIAGLNCMVMGAFIGITLMLCVIFKHTAIVVGTMSLFTFSGPLIYMMTWDNMSAQSWRVLTYLKINPMYYWMNIEIIKAKTDYLTDLVQEFYDLSVVENEQFDVECEKVDINRIVTDCLIEKYYEFGEIQPIIQTEKSPVWIYGNNLICKRIIENLIANAIRYSDNYIEVSINQEGVFMIKNSTQSLDEMDINLLFSKFYTVDKSRTKGGSGLGLYIVKELLKKIDGKIGNIEYNKPILSITLFFRLFK